MCWCPELIYQNRQANVCDAQQPAHAVQSDTPSRIKRKFGAPSISEPLAASEPGWPLAVRR